MNVVHVKYALINNIDFFPFFFCILPVLFFPNVNILLAFSMYLITAGLVHFFVYKPIIKKKPKYSRKFHTWGLISWAIIIIGFVGTVVYAGMYGFQSIFVWIVVLILVLARDYFAKDEI